MYSKIPKYVANTSKEGPPKTDDEKLKHKAETSEIEISTNQKEISRKHELPHPNPMISNKKTVSFYGVFTSTPKPTLNEDVKLAKLKNKTERELELLRSQSTVKCIFPQQSTMTLNKTLTKNGKCEPTGTSQASCSGCAGLKFDWQKKKVYPAPPAKTNNAVGVRPISAEEINAEQKLENLRSESTAKGIFPQQNTMTLNKGLPKRGKYSEPTVNSQTSGSGCAGLKFVWEKKKLYPLAPAKTDNGIRVRQISEEEIRTGISKIKISEESENNKKKVDFTVPQADSKYIHNNKKLERQRSLRNPFIATGVVSQRNAPPNGEGKRRRSKTETDIKYEMKTENVRTELKSTAKSNVSKDSLKSLNKHLSKNAKCSESSSNSQAACSGSVGLKFEWGKKKVYPSAYANKISTIGIRPKSDLEGLSKVTIREGKENTPKNVDFHVPQADSKYVRNNLKLERQRSFKKPFTSNGFVSSIPKTTLNGEVKLRRSKTETDIKYVRKSSKLAEVKSTNEMVAFSNNSKQNKLSLQKYNSAGLNKNMKKNIETTTSSQVVSSAGCDGLKLDWNKAPSSKITRPVQSFSRRRSKSEVDIKALFKSSKAEMASERENNENVGSSDEYGDNLDFNTFISKNFRKSIADGDINITPIPKHNVAHTGLKFNFRKSKSSFNFNIKPRSLATNFDDKSKIN